jgi:hypothetical protein
MSRLQPAHTEGEAPIDYPFRNVGTESELFPPVCLKSHWDPTAMLRYVLPDRRVSLPQDFRPWVKVCKGYRTSAPAEEAPLPPNDLVFPMGGSFYPPGRYSQAIDNESSLRTLDRRLNKWCQTSEYIPPFHGDMYVPGLLVPERNRPTSAMVSELAMPRALIRAGPYECREEADRANWGGAPLLWNNATKQTKFKETQWEKQGVNRVYGRP